MDSGGRPDCARSGSRLSMESSSSEPGPAFQFTKQGSGDDILSVSGIFMVIREVLLLRSVWIIEAS